jgi:probable F420-dependent oxidoreductase
VSTRIEIGATFPQSEFGDDTIAVRDFAQAAEELGYSHLIAYDHVVGARLEHREPKLVGYSDTDPFHEPLVLFGFLAAITSRIELATGILVLPQRQTVLVAKQAAEVYMLSGGRFRLGVGVGWNYVEFEALNEEFKDRGARCNEQIQLLRLLWSEPLLDYQGRWHRIDRASILPRPAQTIPVWVGGSSDPAFRRAARYGDGFIFPGSVAQSRAGIDRLHTHLAEAGRPRGTFGVEVFIEYGAGPDAWVADIEACERNGVTHVAVRSLARLGTPDPQGHIDALADFAAAVGLSGRAS